MYSGLRVAVLVPAFNESRQIAGVIASVPAFVDHVVVVDDGSSDGTGDVVASLQADEPRLVLFRLPENRGVGGALAVAYAWARDHDVDVAVSIDGDGQMDPSDMARLIDPIAAGRADYTKGNRFTTRTDLRTIPRLRLFGNVSLSLLTKIATGYWSIADSQSGYTAAGRYALEQIPWDRVYPRYGRPNDVIWHASMTNCRVADVPIQAIYGVGEKSTMKIARTSVAIAGLLFRRFWQRILVKHVLIDFHPMVFLYTVSLLSGLAGLALFPWVLVGFATTGRFPQLSSIALIVSSAVWVNALFLALFMDLHAHRHVSLPLELPQAHRFRGVGDDDRGRRTTPSRSTSAS